jgi:hypothetical protein
VGRATEDLLRKGTRNSFLPLKMSFFAAARKKKTVAPFLVAQASACGVWNI